MEPSSSSTYQVLNTPSRVPSRSVHKVAFQLLRHPWLWFLLALYLLQALPFLSYRWVTDESWYAGPAYSIAQGHGLRDPAIGPNDIENHLDVRPPGTALVMALFFRLFGAGQITARLGSVLAGAFIVILVYVFTRSVLGEVGARAASLLIATDNLLVLTARTARPEALTVCMVALSLACIALYQSRGGLIWAACCGLAMAMGVMFHITLFGYVLTAGALLIASDTSLKASWWRGISTGLTAFLAGLMPYAAWVSSTSLGRSGFRIEFLSRATQNSMWERLLGEQRRYSDLLGIHMLHGHSLDSLPLRLPIPLLFIFCSYLLWKKKRKWFYVEIAALLPSVLWLIYTVNKSSRYLVLLSPVFAITIGAAIWVCRSDKRIKQALLAAAYLAGIAQFSANLFLLRAAHKADYSLVGRQLQAAIPSDQTAYGTITFWLALRDHNFISYERTLPSVAADQFHARYFIVGDRMMTNSGDFGEKDFYNHLTVDLAKLTARSEAVANIYDNYYGNLTVYHLKQEP